MRIFLAGIACVGKTTVGKHLAELRSCSFFDLDEQVEIYFGISLERLQNRFLAPRSYQNEASKALAALLSRQESTHSVIALPLSISLDRPPEIPYGKLPYTEGKS